MTAKGEPVFRKVALERLSTPEQLDQVMQVASPLLATMLAGVLGLLVVGLVWSTIATAPVNVAAQGMLIRSGGVLNIASDSQGRIVKLLVQSGDKVRAGQTVAVIEQLDTRQELETTKAELSELQGQRQEILKFQDREGKMQIALLNEKQREILQSKDFALDRIKWLETRDQALSQLLEKGIINQQRYADNKLELNASHEALAKAEADLKQVQRDVSALSIRQEREILDKDMAIGAVTRRLEAVTDRLDRQSKVVSPYSGDVVELKVNEGELIARSAALLSLLPAGLQQEKDPGDNLIAILYVSPKDGKKVQPGMETQITPTTVKREEFGFIVGKVRQVAEIPSTAEGMMRTLKNDRLVNSLSTGGAPFEVIANLDRDPETPSGFKWSSSRGPAGTIDGGTPIEATVTVRRIHLISLVIPALEELLDR